MEKRDNTVFLNGLNELGITLNDRQLEQFEIYYDLLVEWNKFMNLTGITDYEEVITKHFLDSLSIVKACDMNSVRSMIDIGTGAGFPGLPIKIAYPDLEVILLDSLNKRINFLNEVITRCSLKGIEAVHGRAEEYIRTSRCREGFDISVSRAVAKLSSLSEFCMPYVRKGGYFISYKSDFVDDEVKESSYAIKVLGGEKAEIVSFTLPETEFKRKLIKVKKTSNTPAAYPRAGGKPLKQPLAEK